MKTYSIRTLIVSAVAPVGILVALLAVQAQRAKWPFGPTHHAGEATARRIAPYGTTQATGAASARAPVELTTKQADMLGIRFETAQRRLLKDVISGVAAAVIDESRIIEVHPRVSGWLERLYVRTTGQGVRSGQPLGAVFSQELYASQLEYLAALRRAGTAPASVVLAAGRTRLKLLGMSEAEIKRVETSRQAQRLVAIAAPRSGFVLDRGATQGISVDPSTNIASIADSSQLWVIVEIAEADATRIKLGSPASLAFPQATRAPLAARVEFIYPMLSDRTRSVRVRMTVPNPGGELRPGMYGTAEISAVPRAVLTIGRDAVVDTGLSQHVFVRMADDRLEPRTVRIGAKSADRMEILEGLVGGEQVASSGVFLLDSESRLRASGAGGHGGHGNRSRSAPPNGASQPAPVKHEHQR